MEEFNTGVFDVWCESLGRIISTVGITYKGTRPPRFIVRNGGYQLRDRLFERYRDTDKDEWYYVEVESENVATIGELGWTDQ